MRMIRHFALCLGIAAAGFAIAAGKHAPEKIAGEHTRAQSIEAIVASSPDFKTLSAVLTAAGLGVHLNVDDSQTQDTYTLFAPTEAAFAKLPAGALDDLLKAQNHDKLVAILRYHLVPEVVEARQLGKLKFVPTLNGDPLTITPNGKQPMVDNARLLRTDIRASNGVIHAIDTLLMPDGK